MSITVSNCDQICNSPTNTSQSKMLYTFPKCPRFSKRKSQLCDKFYDTHVKTSQGTRAASIGYGTKYDFTRESAQSPPPNLYNVRDFSAPKKGFGFGAGRADMQVTGPLLASKSNKNPGPGSYEIKPLHNMSSYTLGQRRILAEDRQRKKVPGPGAYPVTFSLKQDGRYFLAKYKSSGARNFDKSPNRCRTSENKNPGPGQYDLKGTGISNNGKYVSSRMHSSLARRFGNSSRQKLYAQKDSPGPGNYRLPSQFGYYASKQSHTMQQKDNSKRTPLKEIQE